MQADARSDRDVKDSPGLDRLTDFDFQPTTRVAFGIGKIASLGQIARELGGTRVFLVTDKGLAEAGHEEVGVQVLREAGLHVTVFEDVHPNPTTHDVDRALQVAKAANIDLIVGLGGGSSMDCAKGVNFLITNGGRMEDYWGVGKATRPMLPLIAVPTTAGTGSEAQSFALIANPETHMKMACGDKKAACKGAILDPQLSVTMPASVAAVTGIDAISHALETYVTKPRNPISQLFSLKAWQLTGKGFPRVLQDSQDMDARAAMLLGAHFAGAAIENSMLGIAHSLANPLSAHFGMTHGVAIGVMLPHVIRFNAAVVGHLYGELAAAVGICDANNPDASRLLAERVCSLVAAADCPIDLATCGVERDLIPTLAKEAAAQWTANFNPRAVSVDDLMEIYQCALSNEAVI